MSSLESTPTPDYNDLHWLHQLYLQAPVAVAIYLGSEYIIEFANPMMCELWGRQLENVVGKPLFKALPEVSHQGFEEILAEVYKTGEPFTGNELPATMERNGELQLQHFNILYKPLRINHEIKGIIQVATDVTELVEARKKAERSEEIIKTALDGGKMDTWHLDLLQKKLIQSTANVRIYGYDALGQDWTLRQYIKPILPEDRHMVLEAIRRGLELGHLHFEARIKRPNRVIRWIRVSGKTSSNLKDKPLSLSGIVMDITDQKESILRERQLVVERVAREEAEKQRLALVDLLTKAPALISTLYGPDLVFSLVNPQYQRLFPGRTLEGKPMLSALPELAGQPIIEIIKNVYETGETFTGNEVPVQLDRTGSGQLETGYFNITYQALRDSRGAINGILLFAYEVTEQILARKQVESSEKSLRIALEAGKMGTWHLDLIHNTSKRSPLHDQIYGYTKPLKSWSFEQFIEHVLPEDLDTVNAQFDIARRFGDLRFETRIMGADQKLRWIFVKGQTFYEDEKPVSMAGVVMDITERKMVEEKLKELTEELASSNMELMRANEEVQSHMQELSQTNFKLKLTNADLDNFVYTASHDLKTPISNIEGLMNLLLRNMPEEMLEDDRIKKPISLIEASIERFKNTILELTNIARLQKEDTINEHAQLEPVLEEVLFDLQFMIKESNTQLITEIKGCKPVPLSSRYLKSIIYNLLSNAIKYRSPERTPQIRLLCQQQGDEILLLVQDNGLGLKEKDLNKIFSMFTRMHTHVEGSGVGLYLVKRIVDNIGGRLEVESTEGIGSTFSIYFPLTPAQA